MNKRFLANSISILLMLYIIVAQLFDSRQYLFLVLPYLMVNIAMLVMVVRSTYNKPKEVDDSFLVFVVSVIGGNLPMITHFMGISLMGAQVNMRISNAAGLVGIIIMPITLVGIMNLGRNLTVLPEAHQLVVHGIYKYIRHPLYFTYICLYVLQILICQSLAIVLLSAAQISFQLYRAKREEAVLERNFPEYAEYRKTSSWFWK